MPSKPLHAVLFVVVVVLAGCSGFGPGSPTGTGTASSPGAATPTASPATATPTPTGTATRTPTGNGSVKVHINFEPSYDASKVLERVERIRGLNATGPIVVRKYPLPSSIRLGIKEDDADRWGGINESGAKALQLYATVPVLPGTALGYATRRNGTVRLFVMNASGLDRFNFSQEAVLAHELTHALQYQHGLLDHDREPPENTDAMIASTMVSEGNAALVTQRYRDRHLSNVVHVSYRNESARRADWTGELTSILYYYGYRYAKAADGWDERSARLRDPPNTTAAVLHPGSAPSEPGRPVPVPAVPELTARHDDRVGELLVRFALRTNGVPFARAADAAAGWRNDTMVYYEDTSATYWGTRWVNASEAREFATAWRAMLDRLNATRENGLLVVPGTDTYPTMYYAVERTGSVVRIAAAENRTRVRRIAGAWNGTGEGNATDGSATVDPGRHDGAATPGTGRAGAATRPVVRHGERTVPG